MKSESVAFSATYENESFHSAWIFVCITRVRARRCGLWLIDTSPLGDDPKQNITFITCVNGGIWTEYCIKSTLTQFVMLHGGTKLIFDLFTQRNAIYSSDLNRMLHHHRLATNCSLQMRKTY